MIPISQDEIHHFGDGTSLIQSSINIVNQNGLGELSSDSAVYEGVDRLHFSCISGFKLNLQFQGG